MRGKLIVAVAAGMGYGALVGWAVTADYYRRKLREKDEHIDAMRRYPIGKLLSVVETDEGVEVTAELRDIPQEEVLFELEKTPGEKSHDEDVTDEKEGDDEVEEFDEAKTEAIRSNLQNIIDTYTANPDDRDVFVERASLSVHDRTPPFVISRAKYSWDEEEGDEYDKVTVTYYPRERVILDDGDEVMEDVNNVIGWRNLNRFGDESEDADVVFVRNRRLMTDFEVVRDEESELPLHVKYGMGREEFEVNKAAGTLRLRDEDSG